MSRAFDILPAADRELASAAAWYELHGSAGSGPLLAAVGQTYSAITANPFAFAEVYRGVREAPVRRFPYAVYYSVFPSRIEVVAVFHQKRNPTMWRPRV